MSKLVGGNSSAKRVQFNGRPIMYCHKDRSEVLNAMPYHSWPENRRDVKGSGSTDGFIKRKAAKGTVSKAEWRGSARI